MKKVSKLFFFSNNTIGGGIITFKYRYRKQIIVGLIIFILGVTLLACNYKKIFKKEDKSKQDKVVAKFVKSTDSNKKEKTDDSSKKIIYKVDIKGEVKNPGIYSLDANCRVIDVINMAGGLTENANTTIINLSKKIIDEMVIIVYSNEQVKDFEKTKEIQQQVQDKCLGEDIKNDACIEQNQQELPQLISINTATKEELMQIPGIGEAKALEIIKYREENGLFQNIEDIKNVSGIGESLFAKIKENITI